MTAAEVLAVLQTRIRATLEWYESDIPQDKIEGKIAVVGEFVIDQFLFDCNRLDVPAKSYAGLAKIIAIETALNSYGVSIMHPDPAASTAGDIKSVKIKSTEVTYDTGSDNSPAKMQGRQYGALRVEGLALYQKLVHGCRKFPRLSIPKVGDVIEFN